MCCVHVSFTSKCTPKNSNDMQIDEAIFSYVSFLHTWFCFIFYQELKSSCSSPYLYLLHCFLQLLLNNLHTSSYLLPDECIICKSWLSYMPEGIWSKIYLGVRKHLKTKLTFIFSSTTIPLLDGAIWQTKPSSTLWRNLLLKIKEVLQQSLMIVFDAHSGLCAEFVV